MARIESGTTPPLTPPRGPVAPPDATRVAPKHPRAGKPAFDYPGLTLRDVRMARQWKPGALGLDGASANLFVNDAYTQLDKGMSAYLGEPAVPNWMTFGKYASREAGSQILRMEEVLKITHRLDADSLIDSMQDLAKHPKLLGPAGLQLMRLSHGNPVTFVRNTEAIHAALVHGNTGVYADIAPAYDTFLRAEAAGKDGVAAMKEAGFGRAPRDPQGLLLESFKAYQRAHALGAQADKASPEERERLLEQRRQVAHRANLLLGVHEQMVILQGPEVFGDPELGQLIGLLTGSMALTDANGTHPLLPNGGNWANFPDRMGFMEVPEGSDPQAVSVTDHFGVRRSYVMHPDPRVREGSIGQYFLDNLGEAEARRMIKAVPEPLPDSFRDGNDIENFLRKVLAFPRRLFDAITLGTLPGASG